MSGRARAGSIIGFALFLSLASAGTARADIIGSFSWDESCLFTAPCFSVGNFSDLSAFPMDFTDIVVTLLTDQGTITENLNYGLPVGIEAGAQTIGDYSQLQISLATLSFSSVDAGTFALEFFDPTTNLPYAVPGLTMPGDVAAIDFEPSTQPVPEPSTVFLLAAGLGTLGLETLRRRRTARAVRAPG